MLTKEQICNDYNVTINVINHHKTKRTMPEPEYYTQKSGGRLALYNPQEIYEWAKKYGYLPTFDNFLAKSFIIGKAK